MSAITAKASRKMKKYAVLTREPRCFLGSFDFSWEQRKLGELGTITTGNTPSTSIPDYYSDDGIVWVTPTDICENITFESARKLSDLGQQVGRVVPKNTILVTCIASIGKNTMLGNTGSFNQQINGLTPNENKYDPYFLLTESALWSAKMKGSAAAGTMQIVNRTEFSELKTWLPSLIEQQAIGAFFKQLDHLITLHQRKCVFLFGFFQAFISMIFTASTFSWEQRKLGEIGSVSMCRRIFKEQTSETGDIPFYKIGTFGADPDAFISRELFEEYKSKYPYPQKGDILISASGSIGRAVEFAGNNEYFQDSNIVWLNHDERLSNPFLKCFYSVVKWAGIEGSTIKRLYNDNILNTVICMPSVPEQKRIGLFFENLDNLITLHQRKPFLMKWRTSDANRNKTNRLVL